MNLEEMSLDESVFAKGSQTILGMKVPRRRARKITRIMNVYVGVDRLT